MNDELFLYEMGNGLKQIIITLSADNGVGCPPRLLLLVMMISSTVLELYLQLMKKQV